MLKSNDSDNMEIQKQACQKTHVSTTIQTVYLFSIDVERSRKPSEKMLPNIHNETSVKVATQSREYCIIQRLLAEA